ncbi:MAG TPA: hypothetical protein PKH54_08225 [Myxococcota bacterium]|nr:hypothetical protein [Myxococcota bacterium]HOC99918.1 hypothetical protein [Myxococcota bacterium]HOH77791.1 hypothetical protein [Myxococcota bacterium]
MNTFASRAIIMTVRECRTRVHRMKAGFGFDMSVSDEPVVCIDKE